MKKILSAIIICFFIFTQNAFALVGTATTDVYVRDIKEGNIVGSVYKGDKVVIDEIKDGWAKVKINEKDYKIWSEYLTIEDYSADEIESISSPRKSKSTGNPNLKKVTTGKLNKNKELKMIADAFWG